MQVKNRTCNTPAGFSSFVPSAVIVALSALVAIGCNHTAKPIAEPTAMVPDTLAGFRLGEVLDSMPSDSVYLVQCYEQLDGIHSACLLLPKTQHVPRVDVRGERGIVRSIEEGVSDSFDGIPQDSIVQVLSATFAAPPDSISHDPHLVAWWADNRRERHGRLECYYHETTRICRVMVASGTLAAAFAHSDSAAAFVVPKRLTAAEGGMPTLPAQLPYGKWWDFRGTRIRLAKVRVSYAVDPGVSTYWLVTTPWGVGIDMYTHCPNTNISPGYVIAVQGRLNPGLKAYMRGLTRSNHGQMWLEADYCEVVSKE